MQEIPKKGTCLKGTKLAGYTDEKRDVSSVSIKQLRALIEKHGTIERTALSRVSGVYVRSIHRVFRDGEQASMGITMADRLLMAAAKMGWPEYRVGIDLPVYPTYGYDDALTMAVQENLDDDDRLTADQAEIEARIEELLALRTSLLS